MSRIIILLYGDELEISQNGHIQQKENGWQDTVLSLVLASFQVVFQGKDSPLSHQEYEP